MTPKIHSSGLAIRLMLSTQPHALNASMRLPRSLRATAVGNTITRGLRATRYYVIPGAVRDAHAFGRKAEIST